MFDSNRFVLIKIHVKNVLMSNLELTEKPVDWAQMFPSCPQITACVTILVLISWSST